MTLQEMLKCEWRYTEPMQWIEFNHPEKGWSKMIDVRGWGFLTGGGHGALGMDEQKAKDLQDDFGAHVVALLSQTKGADL